MTLIPEVTRPLSDPVLIFALLMVVILIAPRLVQRFKVPGIVGLILAGAILGPSILNLLALEPDRAPPGFMDVLGVVGLMFLMFQAGLSLDLARFNSLRRRSLTFGLFSFFIPQLLSIAVSYYLLGFSIEAALLLGSIIGSHTLVGYPIVAKLGLMKNTPVTMTLGGTLVTDTVSLAILAIVVASLGDDVTAGYWATFGVLVTIFVVLALWGLPRLGHLFFRTVRNRPELEFAFLVSVLFITAWLAGAVGLAPIIGAFVAGLAMNRLVPEQSTLMARIRFVGGTLFVPFFLIYVGLLIDVRALVESLDIWILAGTLIVLVSLGKLAAAKIVQRIYGYTSAEGWTIYGLSVPQAAATLAVTLVGYDVGLFDTTMVNAVVVMILFTCILGPALVEKFGLQMARKIESEPVSPDDFPERIMVPVANPETSADLLDMAFLIRNPDSEEPIFPLMIVDYGEELDERLLLKQKKLDHVVDRGVEAGVPVTPLTRIDMNIAHGIARAAREERISMVLIGWAGQIGARERIFGTVLDQLLDETRQMVFVNNFRYPLNTTRRVVLVIPPFAERSPGFFEAIHNVKLLASRVESELHIVCLEDHLEHDQEFVESIEPELDASYDTMKTWADLPAVLDEDVVDDSTLIVALSARPTTAPWFSELDDIPRMLATRYPTNSYSVVFLSELV